MPGSRRRVLLIDNYDSFTWNLFQALSLCKVEVEVLRNDAMSVDEVLADELDGIVLSPGPGRPENAGICPELLRRMPPELPLLGVCLGHQALVESCGGELEVDPEPCHGRASPIHHDGRGVYAGMPDPFEAGRYHSLRARRDRLPEVLQVAAWTQDGHVMGVRHQTLPRVGVQFHPESMLTELGGQLLGNFLDGCAPPPGSRN
jgi:anthranilate synthase/aminodeoxychorismate synthase-like glutamine amidotransferase